MLGKKLQFAKFQKDPTILHDYKSQYLKNYIQWVQKYLYTMLHYRGKRFC